VELVNSEKELIATDAGNTSTLGIDSIVDASPWNLMLSFKVGQENDNNHNSHHEKLPHGPQEIPKGLGATEVLAII